MSFDLNKKPSLKHLQDVAQRVNAELSPVKNRIKTLEDVGAQANVLESVKVNGAAQSITDKAVDITVPTKVSDLNNDSGFQTSSQVETAINAKVSSTYKAGGSVAFASLPALTEANLGLVVNVTDKFTSTADFVEGAGGKHPAGTNVAVVKVGEDYKYDVLAGFVDLSGYQEAEEGKGLSSNDYTAEEKAKLAKAITTDDLATDAEVAEMLDQVFGTSSEDGE